MSQSSPNGHRVNCALNPHCMSIARWWFALSQRDSEDFYHRRVLVADDDAQVRALLLHVLTTRVKCKSASARDGDEVLRKLAEEPFDVLVTDMVMPGLHGIDLVRKVSADHPEVDIIVTTGFADAFPYVDVLDAGASDFISKPSHAGEIEAKLFRLFHERNLRDQLFIAEEKYRSLFELSMGGNVIVQPKTYTIMDANNAICDLTRRSRSQLEGMNLFGLVDPAERERCERVLTLFEAGGQGRLADVTLVRGDSSRATADISVTYISVPGERILFLTFTDVTERRGMENELAEAAHRDELTQLQNKRSMYLSIEHALSRANREESPLSLLFIDLDNFKRCNDTHGHETGDDLLRTVGVTILDVVRGSGDQGFRYGGDEFAVLLPDCQKQAAMGVAERLRQRFGDTQTYGTSMSIGVAEYAPGLEKTEFLDLADKALYEAKAQGKNTIRMA